MLAEGAAIKQPTLLFEQIDDKQIELQIQKLQAAKKENELNQASVAPQSEDISYDDFSKMDIRVGTILEAEKVAKTKKLLKLTVDTGIDKRTIVSGIAEYYKPEEIIGRQVSVLVNLAPKNLKGIESRGMILMAENLDGSLSFVSPDKLLKNGSVVK